MQRLKSEFGGENHDRNAKGVNGIKRQYKYTFVFEYKGGTYVKQIVDENVNYAISSWAALIGKDIPDFSDEDIQRLSSETQNESPSLLLGMDNVWQLFFLIAKSPGLVTIISSSL